MEDKVLFNTLMSIGTGMEYHIAPDKKYLEALETIGLIRLEWNNSLTDFGRYVLQCLDLKLHKW